ncbi:MAG: 23S rRNA (adenine(2503)-C(2))-methyltransferase RlmN [Bacillota bacterium]|nr:23S rRNA (adenine(2503)-C(2))-methyltransferase RlmN [Bacillota bacterium]
MDKIDLKSLSFDELSEFLKSEGEPAFRAKQVFSWLYKGVTSFSEMTNLSKALREKLSEKCYINILEIEKKQVSKIDGTIKYLFRLMDGEHIETVVMKYEHGNTVCISTEVGCAMGCAFCASCLGGLVRRLTPSEMIDQIMFASKDSGYHIDNIVLMGIGEPLDNFDNVIKFLYNVNHKDGLNIGMRHISLSTCGLVPMIDKLAEYDFQLTLSVSLHASENERRSSIMPVNRRYNIDELMAACRRYFDKTGRRISFEYAIISGVNDSTDDARRLAGLIHSMAAHVNIIPVNSVAERGFVKPAADKIDAFINVLEKHGINATVRRRLGADIDAACGQLRHKQTQQQ